VKGLGNEGIRETIKKNDKYKIMPIFKKWKTGKFRKRLLQIWGTAKELSGYGDVFDRLGDIWKPKQ